jgi:hypothetical protein
VHNAHSAPAHPFAHFLTHSLSASGTDRKVTCDSDDSKPKEVETRRKREFHKSHDYTHEANRDVDVYKIIFGSLVGFGVLVACCLVFAWKKGEFR